jgi:hypothetical protein
MTDNDKSQKTAEREWRANYIASWKYQAPFAAMRAAALWAVIFFTLNVFLLGADRGIMSATLILGGATAFLVWLIIRGRPRPMRTVRLIALAVFGGIYAVPLVLAVMLVVY